MKSKIVFADSLWPNDGLLAIVVKAVVGLVPAVIPAVIGDAIRGSAEGTSSVYRAT